MGQNTFRFAPMLKLSMHPARAAYGVIHRSSRVRSTGLPLILLRAVPLTERLSPEPNAKNEISAQNSSDHLGVHFAAQFSRTALFAPELIHGRLAVGKPDRQLVAL